MTKFEDDMYYFFDVFKINPIPIEITREAFARETNAIRTETIDKCIEIVSNADVDILPSRDIILRDLEKLKEIKND